MPETQKTVPVTVGAETVQGIPIGLTGVDQRSTDVQLDDGTLVQIKALVHAAYRIPDRFDPHGNPVYVITITNTMTASSPDELKRRP